MPGVLCIEPDALRELLCAGYEQRRRCAVRCNSKHLIDLLSLCRSLSGPHFICQCLLGDGVCEAGIRRCLRYHLSGLTHITRVYRRHVFRVLLFFLPEVKLRGVTDVLIFGRREVVNVLHLIGIERKHDSCGIALILCVRPPSLKAIETGFSLQDIVKVIRSRIVSDAHASHNFLDDSHIVVIHSEQLICNIIKAGRKTFLVGIRVIRNPRILYCIVHVLIITISNELLGFAHGGRLNQLFKSASGNGLLI